MKRKTLLFQTHSWKYLL